MIYKTTQTYKIQCNSTVILVVDNISFLPNRKGNNKIITPKEVRNSFPRGRRPQGEEFFTSCGVIILLLPARLGKSSILTYFTNKTDFGTISSEKYTSFSVKSFKCTIIIPQFSWNQVIFTENSSNQWFHGKMKLSPAGHNLLSKIIISR